MSSFGINQLQHIADLTLKEPAELFQHIQINADDFFTIEQRNPAPVQACLLSNVRDFHLSLAHQASQVAPNHRYPPQQRTLKLQNGVVNFILLCKTTNRPDYLAGIHAEKEIHMLVLSRQINESIKIGDDVTVTVLNVRGNHIRIGISAPKDLPVHREEVYLRNRQSGAIQRHGEKATSTQHPS